MFLTPCSTPPQSEASESGENTTETISQIENIPNQIELNETNLYQKLYDCYCLELTDSQILIGKAKDNWRYAHNKGTSSLHVLDRFNISLQIEQRIIPTTDPHYPSLTLSANLPKLVAHLNENKIMAARNLMHIITATGLPSPFKTPDNPIDGVVENADEDDSTSLDTSIEMSRLLMMQFTVDQMSLEVQSRGRCVAELQVAGVKLAFTKRMVDMGITLSVHSLLLVDGLQTFGPDFELLVASHKHVGMDSMSGSLRDSEPTSPTSPASPDPSQCRGSATSPIALTQALSTLATSPLRWTNSPRPPIDVEALITIEVTVIQGQDPMQIANIQFNNLDIIANQETIVELMGFIRRVFPKSQKPTKIDLNSVVSSSVCESNESLLDEHGKIATTQLTFDFHRLNVLLLRGIAKDSMLYGKKICTATMSEAKIHAIVSNKLEVEGSLGGLQVLDLTPEGHLHQRIVSVGRDPLLEQPHPIYIMEPDDSKTAFSFHFVRNLKDNETANIKIRMASLWYTHSPQFVVELQSCATEFKQYLSNLAKSIRTAATDMALGLVHARAEALAQSLYMNARLSSSIYGSALFSESASPRKRRYSGSVDASGYCSARETIPQTPYSPADDDDFIIDIKLDVELDSPVLVLPRASNSTQVFVAHLGKISVSNKTIQDDGNLDVRIEHYDVEVKDMNLYTVETNSRRVPGPMISKPEVLYSCDSFAKPILHDTIVQLNIERHKQTHKHNSDSNWTVDEDEDSNYLIGDCLEISGSVVTALKVSLTRAQYEQLLDTLQWLTSSPTLTEAQGFSRVNVKPLNALTDISEEDTGVTTLNMVPHVRAKLFPNINTIPKNKTVTNNSIAIKVLFELPVFTIELRGASPTGEQGLVDLSFREFIFTYEKQHRYETNIKVSLRSIYMEDLLQPDGSKQRAMVVSSAMGETPSGAACVSRSCPDVSFLPPHLSSPQRGSLPDHLEMGKVFGIPNEININKCPCTPPPSPSHSRTRPQQNLVLISTLLVDPHAPNFETDYNSVQRSTSVDFNCLDLVISVESWVVVIDFFSASPTQPINMSKTSLSSLLADDLNKDLVKDNSETVVSVRSLTVVLVKPDLDIAKANISYVDVIIKTSGLEKIVEGKLGSMSLLDLTLHGQLYRERFLTTGKQALQFKYSRHAPEMDQEYDAELILDMSSVTYVHTKRFVAEIQAFFQYFSQLQSVMRGIRNATSGQLSRDSDEPLRLSLKLQAGSPIILLPVSSKSFDVLIVDLGQLLVTNTFKAAGDDGTISVVDNNSNKRKCLLDVMQIELENMDLYAGVKENDLNTNKKHSNHLGDSFKLGYSQITKKGPSLLTKKFQLRLQVERNLHSSLNHAGM